MVLSSMQNYIYSILGSLSFISGIIFIWCCFKLRSFIHPPGFLMVFISFCVTTTSFYYALFALLSAFEMYLLNRPPTGKISCVVHGGFMLFTRCISWNFALVLSIELIQKVPQGFNKRVDYYYIFCFAISFVITSIAYLTNSLGESLCGTCYIKPKTMAQHSIWLYYIYTPLVIASWVLNKKKQYQVTARLLLTFWILSFPFSLNHTWDLFMGEKNNLLKDIETVSSNLVGLVLYILALVFYEVSGKLQDPLLDEENKSIEKENDNHPEVLKKFAIAMYYIIKNSSEFTTCLYTSDIDMTEKQTWEITLKNLKSTKLEFQNLSPPPWNVTEYLSGLFSNIRAKDSINKNEITE